MGQEATSLEEPHKIKPATLLTFLNKTGATSEEQVRPDEWTGTSATLPFTLKRAAKIPVRKHQRQQRAELQTGGLQTLNI